MDDAVSKSAVQQRLAAARLGLHCVPFSLVRSAGGIPHAGAVARISLPHFTTDVSAPTPVAELQLAASNSVNSARIEAHALKVVLSDWLELQPCFQCFIICQCDLKPCLERSIMSPYEHITLISSRLLTLRPFARALFGAADISCLSHDQVLSQVTQRKPFPTQNGTRCRRDAATQLFAHSRISVSRSSSALV